MPPSGNKNRENMHLSQKRTCGQVDRTARVYGGCYAYEDKYRGRGNGDYCQLGFACKDGKPLEPCLKPVTVAQYCHAIEIIKGASKMETPECEKALLIQEDSQKIGTVLDWLQEQDIHLCSPHTHTEPNCYKYGDIELKEGEYKSWDYMGQAKYIGEKELDCGYHSGEMVYIRESFEKLLARYFNIDLDKVEKEKQAILKEIREVNKK